MYLEITFNVLDGLETLSLFGDPTYTPSGAHVKPEYTQLYQNIKFLDFNDANQIYGIQTSHHHWYVGLGFRKSMEVPSRILRQKGRNKSYLFPVELARLTIDGKPSDKGLELLLSKLSIRSATVYHRAGKILLKANVVTIAERDNFSLRSTFYHRALQKALDESSFFYTIPKDTWLENDRFTVPLARSMGQILAKILSDSNIVCSPELTRIAMTELQRFLNTGTLVIPEDEALINHATPEEKLRIEVMMREIMAAEAELKGLTLDEVQQQYGSTT